MKRLATLLFLVAVAYACGGGSSGPQTTTLISVSGYFHPFPLDTVPVTTVQLQIDDAGTFLLSPQATPMAVATMEVNNPNCSITGCPYNANGIIPNRVTTALAERTMDTQPGANANWVSTLTILTGFSLVGATTDQNNRHAFGITYASLAQIGNAIGASPNEIIARGAVIFMFTESQGTPSTVYPGLPTMESGASFTFSQSPKATLTPYTEATLYFLSADYSTASTTGPTSSNGTAVWLGATTPAPIYGRINSISAPTADYNSKVPRDIPLLPDNVIFIVIIPDSPPA